MGKSPRYLQFFLYFRCLVSHNNIYAVCIRHIITNSKHHILIHDGIFFYNINYKLDTSRFKFLPNLLILINYDDMTGNVLIA